jgi:hypothetical protein
MDTVKHIRERGFRKWYERELMRGHVHLLLLVLSLVGVLGALEALGAGLRQGERLQMLVCLLAAAALSAYAFHGFLSRMARAEFVARQADCPGCATHARWEVEGEGAAANGGSCLRVNCRSCGQRWRINL